MPDVEWISKGADRVIKDFDKVAAAAEKHQNTIKGTAKATEELGRISAKIIKDNETAWQRYERQMVNAKRALDDNKISQQQYNRESVRATIELAKETDATDKNTAAQNRAAAARRQGMRLREAMRLETLRGVSHIQQETASIGAQTVQLGNYATQARSVASSWSQIAGLAGRLAPFLGGAAVLGAMRQDQAATSAAGQRAIESGRAAAGLTELANGSNAQLRRLLDSSRTSYLEGGFADEGGAHSLTFELESGGMSSERAFFSKAQQAGFNSAQLAKDIGTYRKAFEGGDPVGTSAEILSKAAAVSAPAQGVDMGQILAGAKKAAPFAMQLGLTDEENIAFIGKVAEKAGSGETGGDWAAGLYRAFIRRGYVDKNKKSLVGLLGELGSKNLTPSALQEELGRQEASAAFALGGNIPALQESIAAVHAASGSGRAERMFEQALAIPSVATGVAVNAQAAAGQVAEEEEGLRRQRIESFYGAQSARMRSDLPPYLSGPANFFRDYIGSPIIPDSWEDPGTANPNAPGEMDVLLQILEQNKRAEQQRQRQIQIQERQAGRGRAPAPMGKPE